MWPLMITVHHYYLRIYLPPPVYNCHQLYTPANHGTLLLSTAHHCRTLYTIVIDYTPLSSIVQHYWPLYNRAVHVTHNYVHSWCIWTIAVTSVVVTIHCTPLTTTVHHCCLWYTTAVHNGHPHVHPYTTLCLDYNNSNIYSIFNYLEG